MTINEKGVGNSVLEKSVTHKVKILLSGYKDQWGSDISFDGQTLTRYQVFKLADYIFSAFYLLLLIGVLVLYKKSIGAQVVCFLIWYWFFSKEIFVPFFKGVKFEFDVRVGMLTLFSRGIRNKRVQQVSVLDMASYKIWGGAPNGLMLKTVLFSANKKKYVLGYFRYGYEGQRLIEFFSEIKSIYKHWDEYGQPQK